jgi:Cysteine-rich CWC
MPFSLWSLFIDDLPRVKLKNCGSCGRDFICYGKHCWCEAIELDRAVLQRLRKAYKDCLCPDCLK